MGSNQSIIECPDGSFRVNKTVVERSVRKMQEANTGKIQIATEYRVTYAIFAFIQWGKLPRYRSAKMFMDIYAEADVYGLQSLRELMIHNLYYDVRDGCVSYSDLRSLTDDEDILRVARAGSAYFTS